MSPRTLFCMGRPRGKWKDSVNWKFCKVGVQLYMLIFTNERAAVTMQSLLTIKLSKMPIAGSFIFLLFSIFAASYQPSHVPHEIHPFTETNMGSIFFLCGSLDLRQNFGQRSMKHSTLWLMTWTISYFSMSICLTLLGVTFYKGVLLYSNFCYCCSLKPWKFTHPA